MVWNTYLQIHRLVNNELTIITWSHLDRSFYYVSINTLYAMYSIKYCISSLYIQIALYWQIMVKKFSCWMTSWIDKIAPIKHNPFKLFQKFISEFLLFFFISFSCLVLVLWELVIWCHIWKLGGLGREMGDWEEKLVFLLSQSQS